jgi:hypothetical protein
VTAQASEELTEPWPAAGPIDQRLVAHHAALFVSRLVENLDPLLPARVLITEHGRIEITLDHEHAQLRDAALLADRIDERAEHTTRPTARGEYEHRWVTTSPSTHQVTVIWWGVDQ